MNQLNTHHKLHAEYFHLSLATDLLRKTEQKHNFLSEHGGTLYGASQACLRSGSSGFSLILIYISYIYIKKSVFYLHLISYIYNWIEQTTKYGPTYCRNIICSQIINNFFFKVYLYRTVL